MNKKIIIAVVGVIVLGEIVWAWMTFFRDGSLENVGQAANSTRLASKSSFSLQVSKNTFKVGETVPVRVNIYSDKLSAGADVVLLYDPKVLAVQGPEPVKVSPELVYNTYPLNKADESGRITVSGITPQASGIVAKGVFGNIVFQAKAPGQAKIKFDFTPGSTVDSNIIEAKSSKDVLEEVNFLEVNITP